MQSNLIEKKKILQQLVKERERERRERKRMADAKEAREARRRRLVARGEDRLAFITGQSRSFRNDDLPLAPPTPPATATATAEEVTAPPKIQADDQITSSASAENYERKERSLKETRAEILPKNEPSAGSPNFEAKNEISKSVPSNETHKLETDNNRRVEPSPCNAHRSADWVGDTAPPPQAVATKTSFISFTPNQISSSISATEDIRLLSAIIVSLLVVISYHLGIGGIFSFRPLFLVLLTDASVVFGRLLLNRGGGHKEEEAKRTGLDGEDWDIGKMLEAVMVLQKASSAAFMDCSICAVIMICGVVF